MSPGNLLILQSGLPSAVSNSALYGALSEALNYETIEEIYGACNGFEGILSQTLVDLAALSQKKAKLLLSTAGSALGYESCNFQPTDDEFKEMIGILSQHNIRLLAVIGDRRSVYSTQRLLQVAQAEGYTLCGIVIPQSNDNEFPITDHSLGYGSTLKCLTTLLLSFERLLQDEAISVGICEVSGAGSWVTAGATLLASMAIKSTDGNNFPYVVCLPEQPFSNERFLEIVQNKLQHRESVLVVTHSHLINEELNKLDIGAFGSAGAYLEQLLQSELNIQPYFTTYNLPLQPVSCFISKQDQTEALDCSSESIHALVNGESENAAILVRGDNKTTSCNVTFVPLKEVVGMKFFPSNWISTDTMTLQYHMLKYAQPLIQGEVVNTFEKGLPQLFCW